MSFYKPVNNLEYSYRKVSRSIVDRKDVDDDGAVKCKSTAYLRT